MVNLFTTFRIVQTEVKNFELKQLPLSECKSFGGPYVNAHSSAKALATTSADIDFNGTDRVSFEYLSVIMRRYSFPLAVFKSDPNKSIATDSSGPAGGNN